MLCGGVTFTFVAWPVTSVWAAVIVFIVGVDIAGSHSEKAGCKFAVSRGAGYVTAAPARESLYVEAFLDTRFLDTADSGRCGVASKASAVVVRPRSGNSGNTLHAKNLGISAIIRCAPTYGGSYQSVEVFPSTMVPFPRPVD